MGVKTKSKGEIMVAAAHNSKQIAGCRKYRLQFGGNLYPFYIAIYLPLLFLLSIIFISCYSGKKNDKKIFHYNEQTGIASLDPAFAKNQSIMWSIHQLYNTLVEIDDSLRIVPSLATSWEVSEDRLSYIFHLRNDVYFHDDPCFPGNKGRKLLATDIAYSFSRILDKQTASPGAWIFNRKVDTLQPFIALDDSTFQLRLLKPYNPIL